MDSFSDRLSTNISISDVIDELDKDLGPHFFPAKADGSDPRACPACSSCSSAASFDSTHFLCQSNSVVAVAPAPMAVRMYSALQPHSQYTL